MKLKILMVPVLIVLSIILLIWFVVPAFSDEITKTGVIQKRNALAQEEEKMGSLGAKITNVEKLSSQLATSDKKGTIYRYIPENKNEEEIVGNLNALAKDNGASVSDLSITDAKEAYVEPVIDMSYIGADGQTVTPLLIAPVPKAKEMEVSYSIVGKYENIKTILDKIYRLKRFNRISLLEMTALVNEGGSVSDNIKADAVLNFSYLKSKTGQMTPEETVDKIFSSGVFDVSIADKIEGDKSTDISTVDPGQKGKVNPFLP